MKDKRTELTKPVPVGLWPLTLYFLKLGAFGFGGPVALAGYMQRDLAEERGWITREEYHDGLAIAQTMPGPLAAQLAMWIGFIRYGVLGATLVGIVFVLPPFIIVSAVAVAYVAFEGLPQIRALFYGIGPAAIAIVALTAWKLARSTDGRDAKLWLTSAVLMAITIAVRAELAWLFVLAGVVAIAVYAPPWRRAKRARAATLSGLLPLPLVPGATLAVPAATGSLLVLTLFFLKAAAFTFGSGLAIVPFLHAGVVVEHHWLDERQFLDAVAMGIITPGPVVIMATFVGYLAAGMTGAVLATFGVFAPVWVFNVVVGKLFLRHRANPQVRAFVKGATAAAVGAIAGASVILAEGAMVDHPGATHWSVPWGLAVPLWAGAQLDLWTVAIFLIALAALCFRKLKEPYIVGLAGAAGLLLFTV